MAFPSSSCFAASVVDLTGRLVDPIAVIFASTSSFYSPYHNGYPNPVTPPVSVLSASAIKQTEDMVYSGARLRHYLSTGGTHDD